MSAEGEFDIVVIGGGPGGYATALYGAAAGLSVAIVERDKVGGTCLHRGCIPAKEFLETAAVYRTVEGSKEFGVGVSGVTLDFAVSQDRKNAVVDKLFRGLSGLLKGRKVTTLHGIGTLQAGNRVSVSGGEDAGRVVSGRNVVLAAGSVPRTLPGFEVDGRWVMTSDEFLDLKALPASVAVIGGGVIGCEFASLLADLGSRVTIVEALDSILAGCDDDIIRTVARSFKKRGIEIVTGAMVEGHRPAADGSVTTVKAGEQTWDVEAVVVSVGRRPRTEGLVAEGVGVTIDQRGFVVADEYQRTGVPGVYAVGDLVAGTPQLAHVGFAEAIVAVKGILGEAVVPVDNGKVPWAIYCHPEVAFCGMSEEQAKAAGFDVLTKKDPFGGNSRAQIIGDTEGVVKIVAERRPDGTAGRILGVHLCGPWVTEQLSGGYLAVNWEAFPDEVAQFIQPHPSLSETFGETMLALTGRDSTLADVMMPQLGETVTEGTITRWMKGVGDTVERDEPLFEVSTDKVDSEVPSPAAGVLTEILVPEGETVEVGVKLAVIGDGSGSAPAAPAPPAESAAPAPPPPPPPPAAAPPPPPPAPAPRPRPRRSRSTQARAMASAQSRCCSRRWCVGCSPRTASAKPRSPGREPAGGSPARTPCGSSRRAARAAAAAAAPPAAPPPPPPPAAAPPAPPPAAAPPAPPPAAAPPAPPPAVAPPPPPPAASPPAVAPAAAPAAMASPAPQAAPVQAAPPARVAPSAPPVSMASFRAAGDQIVPFSNMRRRTAEHMVRSKATSPHAFIANEVDFEAVERVRNAWGDRFKAEEGFSLTYLPFVARAAVEALRDFPLLNASVVDDSLLVHAEVNLGFAVDLSHEGLIVPVVHRAEEITLRGIARRIRDLAERARSRQLNADDIAGGTFSITNDGPFGTYFTVPIINQPQVAILATDGIARRPVVVTHPDGSESIAIHSTGILGVSWDHRAVDGAYVSLFLARVAALLGTRDWSAEL